MKEEHCNIPRGMKRKELNMDKRRLQRDIAHRQRDDHVAVRVLVRLAVVVKETDRIVERRALAAIVAVELEPVRRPAARVLGVLDQVGDRQTRKSAALRWNIRVGSIHWDIRRSSVVGVRNTASCIVGRSAGGAIVGSALGNWVGGHQSRDQSQDEGEEEGLHC
ncbi:hypothetical protein BC828DRAFT_375520 [Blastocladiella britannica]|nr:hypothetical protein BC828DRAFT_375520 [Blastocladiella britannica]